MNDYIHDAIELVSGWDLPDTEFAQAVNDQARLMAGIPFDYGGDPLATYFPAPSTDRHAALSF